MNTPECPLLQGDAAGGSAQARGDTAIQVTAFLVKHT